MEQECPCGRHRLPVCEECVGEIARQVAVVEIMKAFDVLINAVKQWVEGSTEQPPEKEV